MSISKRYFGRSFSLLTVAVFALSILLTSVVALNTSSVQAAAYNVERAQYAFNEGNPVTATLGSTPAEGNVLVATAFSRSGVSADTHMISGSDWIKVVSHDAEISNSSARRAMSIWTKTAAAAEPSAVTVSGDTGDVKLLVQEFSTPAVGGFTFVEAAVNDNGADTNANSLATGATSLIGGDTLWVSALGVRNDKNVNISGVDWDVTGGAVHSDGGHYGRTLNSAWATDSSTSEKSDTANWKGNNTGATAALLVFSVSDMCQLVPATGRTIIDFAPYEFLRSDKTEAEATRGPFNVDIPAGEYVVTVHSWDDHSAKGAQDQPNESWLMILDGTVYTNPSSDLPVDLNHLVEVTEDTIVITDDVSEVVTAHAAYPDDNPNSIYPICAAFDLVEDEGEVAGETDQVEEEPVGSVDAGEAFQTGNTNAFVILAFVVVLASGAVLAYRQYTANRM